MREPEQATAAVAGTLGPPRIAGIRIAYVGARPGSVACIREYWEGRGAVFMPYPGLADTSLAALERLLGHADMVFLCAGCIDERVGLRLQMYCNHTEKTLIPLHNAGLSGLRRALGSWCSLAGAFG